MDFELLPNLVTFSPLLGVLILFFIKPEKKELVRWVSLLTALVTFGISLVLLGRFDASNTDLQMVTNLTWIKVAGWNISYYMGVDGLSILLILLTTFLTPIAILSTWSAIEEREKDFNIFFLMLEVGMLGVFMAQDLFLFYVFWEFTLVPMYFLIGIWGGPERIYASIKFFLYTMAGSLLMLLAILWLGINQGTFAVPDLIAMGGIPAGIQNWLFIAFAVAFAIKVPMWPLHSWLPDAHVQAPTAGSVILAGVLLKMGTYGFVRFNLPLFPNAAIHFAPTMAFLAVVGIIYGAIVSYYQRDIKKLVAYSSISHLGFVMLGLFALNSQGIQGGILQMINHGLSTGALFLLVGMIYEQTHTRDFDVYGGLWKIMPVYGTVMLVVTLSSMGLPGLNGFVGEFTILLGAFGSEAIGSAWYAGISAIGVILAAIYMLYMYQKIFLGPEGSIVQTVKDKGHPLRDLSVRELVTIVPLLVFIFWIGLYPKPFFALIAPTVDNLVKVLQAAMG
ncbi:MAG: NADH-quinone oxidoreductase subunit M [Anaerolineae bacterium]|jgi:NADH-quinone oxidoreductase subunit M|nr:NADH-quinone oxidoreductase subunit M [Anaerolineae bacterium]MBT3714854.1 NADH-quinone oxidoreductase subunit M [Anaerolineae bacterium]MBT4309315.1 NADH-quinone oxidoreductase subunit M [Anaerolineae bacterium]MBT4460110.1 NADH-quinone oxidoreductase subunit M [Anaerolineae bacterium]MBT4842975.1 NADH-quinone oxidoreductase subunit M [Anaerolineae bacterium]